MAVGVLVNVGVGVVVSVAVAVAVGGTGVSVGGMGVSLGGTNVFVAVADWVGVRVGTSVARWHAASTNNKPTLIKISPK